MFVLAPATVSGATRAPSPRSSRRSHRMAAKHPAGANDDPDGEPPPELRPSGPLTEGEKAFLDFLFEQAVKPWS